MVTYNACSRKKNCYKSRSMKIDIINRLQITEDSQSDYFSLARCHYEPVLITPMHH
jgi:hypothetical protein